MPVIIVGAGIGGLTTALALTQRGVRSVILERAERLEEVGAGLQLSPNACRVLFGLGLESEVRRIGFAPDVVTVRSAADGRALLCNRLGGFAEARWETPYLQVRRAALQTVLAEAVHGSGLVDVQFGRQVVGLEGSGSETTVRLADGGAAQASAVIGCDGLNSLVRQGLWGNTPARFTGQTAWRGLAAASDVPPEVASQAVVWAGRRKHFVHYPVGEGFVNMVAVVEADDSRSESWSEPGQQAMLAAAFADWPAPVRAIIAAAGAPWRSALYDRPPLDRWSKGRATLLGDAAHPMLPFLAQGAAMAIEDAAALAEALTAGANVEGALLAYEAARRPRTSRAQAWATRNAILFHLPDPALKAAFAAASLADRLRARPGEARFDWLYGF